MITFLEVCSAEFENEIERQVEREFETRLASGVTKLPWIDGTYDPEQQTEQKQRIIRALLARKWFEAEAGTWATLPLNEDERVQLNSTGTPRLVVTANYAMMLEAMDWDYARAPSFFDYVRQSA